MKNPEKIRVYEQNFEKNLVNKNEILKKYINKELELYIEMGETAKRVKGTLLGYDDGYIIKTDKGVNIFNRIAGI